MSGQWLTQQTSPIDVHVLPLDDVIVHDHNDSCPCGPEARIGPRNNGVDGWIHTHHSLDGREFTEPGYEGESQP